MSNNESQQTDCELEPFRRNRYYFGKLLSSKNLQLEQDYVNGKRELINKLLYGNGVLCGYKTEQIAENTRGIRVFPGVALGPRGEEIVLPDEYLINDISLVNGFSFSNSPDTELILCIERQDCFSELVPVPEDISRCGEQCEFDIVKEGVRFSFKDSPPNCERCTHCAVWIATSTVYNSPPFKIERILPRWVEANETYAVQYRLSLTDNTSDDFRIIITEVLPQGTIHLGGLSVNGELEFVVQKNAKQGVIYTAEYLIYIDGEPDRDLTIRTTVSVPVNSRNRKICSSNFSIHILSCSLIEHLVREHYDGKSNTCPSCMDSPVGIAKIKFQKKSDIPEITGIEPIPCNQFVYSHQFLFDLILSLQKRIGVIPLLRILDDGVEQVQASRILNFKHYLKATSAGEGQANIELGNHAEMHQAGNPDAINVSNLNGVLKQPQKITILHEGSTIATPTTLNFKGDNIVIKKTGNASVDISINNRNSSCGVENITVTNGKGKSGIIPSSLGGEICVSLGLKTRDGIVMGPKVRTGEREYKLNALVFTKNDKLGTFEITVEDTHWVQHEGLDDQNESLVVVVGRCKSKEVSLPVFWCACRCNFKVTMDTALSVLPAIDLVNVNLLNGAGISRVHELLSAGNEYLMATLAMKKEEVSLLKLRIQNSINTNVTIGM